MKILDANQAPPHPAAAATDGGDTGCPDERCARDASTAAEGCRPASSPASAPLLDAGPEPCCGPSPGPPADIHERPGYRVRSFVEGFITTTVGDVPRLRTHLSLTDRLGALRTRLGFSRSDYRVAPGLYAVGHPDADAPVLVTANYKLTFDTLRRRLGGIDTWILVLDTRGINVWCAAGKGTFATEELIRRVHAARLKHVVRHRKLVLPQLGATGVAAHEVRRRCGYRVHWGPIRAGDVAAFLDNGMLAETTMRRLSFPLAQRIILIPVELTAVIRRLLWLLPLIVIVSGLGRGIFSPAAAGTRGLWACSALLTGVISGAVLAPALLPWLPGRAFSLKGALTGALTGTAIGVCLWNAAGGLELAALWLVCVAASSYLAMNFTGSTPFTSPSGVEKEMRRALPLQALAAVCAVGLWIGASF